MKILGWFIGLIGLFLILYYYVGAREIIGATSGALNTTAGTLMGQTLPGRSFPGQYPK